MLALGKVVADFIKIDVLQILICPLGRHGLLFEDFERLEAKLAHPIGIVFDVANVFDGVFGEANARIEFIVFRILEVSLLGIDLNGLVL